MNSSASDYSAKSVVVLEGLEPVRKRPAMYIGSTSLDGAHHCLNEIIDNSIDESLAGFCSEIQIIIEDNGYCTVIDNGRGIPTDIMPAYKKSALEIILTKLHAGAKFDAKAYKVSGGLHGVGSSVVNALSEHMIAEVKRNNKFYQQEYRRGVPQGPVKTITKSRLEVIKGETGTAISFKLDKEIFTISTDLEIKRLLREVRERAYLIPKVLFKVYDNRIGLQKGFFFEGGITSRVKRLFS
jgi:DNA gyrase subunit B